MRLDKANLNSNCCCDRSPQTVDPERLWGVSDPSLNQVLRNETVIVSRFANGRNPLLFPE
jgi:hypothetical protein